MLRIFLSLLVATIPALSFAAEPTAKDLDFFEKKIRPVLTEHCSKCHSAKAEKDNKLKGGLLLDSKKGVLDGGDSGVAIVPGKPKDSLLLKSLRYEGDSHMPPAGKLPDAVIKDFETWIAMGAPDPRTGGGVKRQIGMSIADGKNFWSYKPVANTPLPMVKDKTWATSPIDHYILAGLEKKALKPVADADKPTLIRRLYYDLVGLPPTPEQVEAFVNNKNPDAYEKLVTQLMDSPEFGERWGRHWLDVARYAESLTLRGFILKDAWRYRDYVIESFNKDVPFNQFVREQVAGDLMKFDTSEQRARQLIATGFLVLGNTNLEEQDKKVLRMDYVDEMLDVMTKGFLGQTVTCARCHDHKFDPIPTKDYYAMAGILRNSKAMEHSNVSKWIEVPLPAPPEIEAKLKQHEAKIALLLTQIKAAKTVASAKAPPKGVLAIKDIQGIVVDDTQAKKVGKWVTSTFNKDYIGEGYVHDDNKEKGTKTLTFDPVIPTTGRYEVRIAYSSGTSRSNKVPVTLFSADGEKEIDVDMTKTPPIDGRFLSLGEYRFEKKGQSFVIVSNEGTKGHVTADCVVFIPVKDKDKEQNDKQPKPKGDPDLKALEAELKALQANGPKRPMAISLVEETKMEDCRVHIRGLVSNQGDLVPRGVMQVASTGKPLEFPKDQSGRLQLADWIASAENPLTARVFVNRSWHWLMGSGIVRTVDNFGTTGETPSNPELLDYLAQDFVKNGWSIKKLIRSIVMSRTYQLQSITDPQSPAVKADPENLLFGRANRKRMDVEIIRDTMLSISGKLDTKRGGLTFAESLATDYNYKSTELRRSVYLPVFRNAIPDMFEAFDFADPSIVVGKRSTSTVAPQALYFMNNPFPMDQAKAAAEKLLKANLADDRVRLEKVYEQCLGRMPTSGEAEATLKYIQGRKDATETWTTVYQMLFATADFRYVN